MKNANKLNIKLSYFEVNFTHMNVYIQFQEFISSILKNIIIIISYNYTIDLPFVAVLDCAKTFSLLLLQICNYSIFSTTRARAREYISSAKEQII